MKELQQDKQLFSLMIMRLNLQKNYYRCFLELCYYQQKNLGFVSALEHKNVTEALIDDDSISATQD